jgi:hypothetical protein
MGAFTMQPNSLESLVGRLDTLERQNWRLKLAVYAVPLIGLALVALVAADTGKDGNKKDTVTTQKLILQDDKGKTTALLENWKDGPHLLLLDGKGQTRVNIAANSEGNGPAVFLVDAKDKCRATLRMLNDDYPAFYLYGEGGKSWVVMDVNKDNRQPFIELHYRDGSHGWGVGGYSFKKK